jgi:hypothetical protein
LTVIPGRTGHAAFLVVSEMTYHNHHHLSLLWHLHKLRRAS